MMFEPAEQELDYRELPSVTVFAMRPVTRSMVTGFVEKWHYSHSINGLKDKYCFALYHESNMIGAAIFGEPATPGVAEAYSKDGTLQVIELRRLCCIDNTPRNTESFFIGQMFKWLRKNTKIDVILSYSDKTYGHEGTIYKATNFELVGESPAVDKILYKGKLYHDKALRVYNGSKSKGAKQKPFSIDLARALAAGEAVRVPTKPKNIYIMYLSKTALLSNKAPTRLGAGVADPVNETVAPSG
jgi:hypothetical protein